MNITFLANVKPGPLNYIICVRVSRMWEFRGRDEENEIRHLDLVVIDQKGYSMYAEIPPDAIPLLQPTSTRGENCLYDKDNNPQCKTRIQTC